MSKTVKTLLRLKWIPGQGCPGIITRVRALNEKNQNIAFLPKKFGDGSLEFEIPENENNRNMIIGLIKKNWWECEEVKMEERNKTLFPGNLGSGEEEKEESVEDKLLTKKQMIEICKREGIPYKVTDSSSTLMRKIQNDPTAVC